jgi:hypothetical protein
MSADLGQSEATDPVWVPLEITTQWRVDVRPWLDKAKDYTSDELGRLAADVLALLEWEPGDHAECDGYRTEGRANFDLYSWESRS